MHVLGSGATPAMYFATLLILMVMSNPAQAQALAKRPQPPDAAAPAGAEIDLQLSRVYIRVGKTGLGHPHGVEGRLASGRLLLGATQNAGDLIFDMRSFFADTPAARARVGLEGETDAATQKKVNANMRGPDVLDVDRFPQARFRIASATPRKAIAPGEPPIYDIVGQFTLHGVTRPLRFEAVVNSAEGRSGVSGRFSIKQTDFGITPYTAALGAVGVADTLEIWGDLWFAPVRQARR